MTQPRTPQNGRVPGPSLPEPPTPDQPAVPPPPPANSHVAASPSDPRSSIALALSWLALAGLLVARPDYLGHPTAAFVTSVVLGCLGISGLSTALHQLASVPRTMGRGNPGVGLLLGMVWALIYANSPLWWVNLLTAPILILACYGSAFGLLTTMALAFRPSPSWRVMAVGLLLAALQLAACAAVVVLVLSQLGLVG